MLSNFVQVIEKLMHQRLNQFLEENECFYPHQFGFRLNLSINNLLMSKVATNSQIKIILQKSRKITRVKITEFFTV